MKQHIRIVAVVVVSAMSLVASIAMRAQSEARWGFTAGANYNEIHFKQSDILNTDPAFSPMAGVTGELNIPGIGFSVDASLLYSMRSGKINYGERKVWSSLGLANETCQMHYVDLPVHLKFKYQKLNGFENKLMPMIFVGPTFSFMAGSNLKDVNSYSPVSVYLHFGVGAEIVRRVQVTAGFGFSIGETFHTKLLDENVAKNRTWNATVTYYLK